MRVWKLEASATEERHPSIWGYALAETRNEALAIASETSGLPFNWVHEKHPEMLWPGRPCDTVDWGSFRQS